MDWFYAQNGQQLGPVSESYLGQLARSGVVSPDTLVWHSGMLAWQPYRTASATFAVPLRFCNSCGNGFPPSDLAMFGDSAICLSCQPAYVQRLRQGMAPVAGSFRYAGFWIRVLASIIDSVILQIAQYAILIPLGLSTSFAVSRTPEEQMSAVGLTVVLSMALNLCYHVVFWTRYGATPGKMALGLKVVRTDGSVISTGQAIGRYFAFFLDAIILGIGFMMAGWDSEKRTLHDRIAETRVIRTR